MNEYYLSGCYLLIFTCSFGTYPKGPKAKDIEWLKSRISQVKETSSIQKTKSVEVSANLQHEKKKEPEREKVTDSVSLFDLNEYFIV